MSNVTLTDEYLAAAETFSLKLDDLEKITINAMKSAFLPHDERLRYIYDILKPGSPRFDRPPNDHRPGSDNLPEVSAIPWERRRPWITGSSTGWAMHRFAWRTGARDLY